MIRLYLAILFVSLAIQYPVRADFITDYRPYAKEVRRAYTNVFVKFDLVDFSAGREQRTPSEARLGLDGQRFQTQVSGPGGSTGVRYDLSNPKYSAVVIEKSPSQFAVRQVTLVDPEIPPVATPFLAPFQGTFDVVPLIQLLTDPKTVIHDYRDTEWFGLKVKEVVATVPKINWKDRVWTRPK